MIEFLVGESKTAKNTGDFALIGKSVSILKTGEKLIVFNDNLFQLSPGELRHELFIHFDLLFQINDVLFYR